MFQIQIGEILKDNNFNPVHFGGDIPAPPYVVIKPGKDPLSRGTAFKIIVHRKKGEIYQLDQDMINIISLLESNFLYQDSDFDPTVFSGNDDNTISREHNFLMVSKY